VSFIARLLRGNEKVDVPKNFDILGHQQVESSRRRRHGLWLYPEGGVEISVDGQEWW
jgi:hypothetical protein